jgi:hypothetical protein
VLATVDKDCHKLSQFGALDQILLRTIMTNALD